MILIEEWKWAWRKAHGIKLSAVAGALSSLEVVLPYLTDVVPKGVFIGLAALVGIGAILNTMVQKRVRTRHGERPDRNALP